MTAGQLGRTAGVLSAAAVAALLTILYVVYVGRVLGPAEYSDFSASLSIIYLVAVAVSPVAPTIARIAARRTARGEIDAVAALRRAVLARLTSFVAVLALLAAVAIVPLAKWLNLRSPVPLALAVASALLFALLSADRGVLQGLMRFREYNVNLLIEAAIRLGGAWIAMALLGATAGVALLSYAGGVVVAGIVIAVTFRREWRSAGAAVVDWGEVRQLIVPMLGLMSAAALFQNVDMLAVKRWFPAADAGVYGAAVAVSRAFGVIFVPLYVLAGPTLAAAHERRLPVRAQGVRIAALYAALCAVPLSMLWIWAEPLMTLLYGRAFAGGAGLLVLLGGVSVLLHTGLLLTQILVALDEFAFVKLYAAAASCLLVALALFHRDLSDIVGSLYAVQTALLGGLAFLVWRAERPSQP